MKQPVFNVAVQGSGPPLVLLHGLFLGSLAQWYFTAAPALAASHTVVMFDLRGHGRSSREASGYDLDTLVTDLERVLADQGLSGPVRLAGHSYGGLIALKYASRHPVEKLALIDVPVPGFSIRESYKDPEALLAAVPESVRALVLGGGRRTRRLLESLRFLAQDSTLFADLNAEPKLTGLEQMQTPTLLVYGDASGCLDSRSHLEASLPQVRSVTLAGGHFLPVEAPAALTAELVGFFDG